MRFINTSSLKFRELSDSELRKLKNGYCVLSHRWTWGHDEIQYADILSKESDLKIRDGYSKFAGACALAKTLGYDLIWIDTCCIDKTDSVELGEAINSMYRWYSESKLCIAYLQDVTSSADIGQSEWFNRGWTLQELIAPKNVRFYGRNWNFMGDKDSLSQVLASKTGIPSDILKRKTAPRSCSVAQRMSWAAKRTTTRIEDRAYSLMGLFDVNMPMVYGERELAFMRLQENIIAKSADESIFVWDLDLLEDSTRDAKEVHCGLLATSPACFARCGNVIATGRSQGFRINQFGLSISLLATPRTLRSYNASLKVTKENTKGQCALILAKLPDGESYARVSSSTGESIVITQKVGGSLLGFSVPMEPRETPVHLYPGFWLRRVELHDPQTDGYKWFSRLFISTTHDRLKLPEGEFGTAGLIKISLRNQLCAPGWVKLGFDSVQNPVCFLTFPPFNSSDEDDPNRINIPERFPQLANRAKHPLFDDAWLRSRSINPDLPDYCYDSRMISDRAEEGFEFTFKAPLFKIAICAVKVPEMSTTDKRKAEVWAVDIVVGDKPPPPPPQYRDPCCC